MSVYRAGCARAVAGSVVSRQSVGWCRDSHRARVAFGRIALATVEVTVHPIRAGSSICPDPTVHSRPLKDFDSIHTHAQDLGILNTLNWPETSRAARIATAPRPQDQAERLAGEAVLLISQDIRSDLLAGGGPDPSRRDARRRWARANPRLAALLIDRIDALIGDTLLPVLHELRSEFGGRLHSFSQSFDLFGIPNLRDYRMRSRSSKDPASGGGAFNSASGPL